VFLCCDEALPNTLNRKSGVTPVGVRLEIHTRAGLRSDFGSTITITNGDRSATKAGLPGLSRPE